MSSVTCSLAWLVGGEGFSRERLYVYVYPYYVNVHHCGVSDTKHCEDD